MDVWDRNEIGDGWMDGLMCRVRTGLTYGVVYSRNPDNPDSALRQSKQVKQSVPDSIISLLVSGAIYSPALEMALQNGQLRPRVAAIHA